MKPVNFYLILCLFGAQSVYGQELHIDGYIHSKTEVEIAEEIHYRHSADCYILKRANKYVQHKPQTLIEVLDLNNTKKDIFRVSDSTSGLFQRRIRSLVAHKRRYYTNNLFTTELRLSDSYRAERSRIYKRQCSHSDGISKPTIIKTKIDMEMLIRIPDKVSILPVIIETSGVFDKVQFTMAVDDPSTHFQILDGRVYLLAGKPNAIVRVKIKSNDVIKPGHDLGFLKITAPTIENKMQNTLSWQDRVLKIVESLISDKFQFEKQEVIFILSDLVHLAKEVREFAQDDAIQGSGKLLEIVHKINQFQFKNISEVRPDVSTVLVPVLKYYLSMIQNEIINVLISKMTKTCSTQIISSLFDSKLNGLYFANWYSYHFQNSVVNLRDQLINQVEYLKNIEIEHFDHEMNNSLNRIMQSRKTFYDLFNFIDGFNQDKHDKNTDLGLSLYIMYRVFRETVDLTYHYEDFKNHQIDKFHLIQLHEQWIRQITEILELNDSNRISLLIQDNQISKSIELTKLVNQQLDLEKHIEMSLINLSLNIDLKEQFIFPEAHTLYKCMGNE